MFIRSSGKGKKNPWDFGGDDQGDSPPKGKCLNKLIIDKEPARAGDPMT